MVVLILNIILARSVRMLAHSSLAFWCELLFADLGFGLGLKERGLQSAGPSAHPKMGIVPKSSRQASRPDLF